VPSRSLLTPHSSLLTVLTLVVVVSSCGKRMKDVGRCDGGVDRWTVDTALISVCQHVPLIEVQGSGRVGVAVNSNSPLMEKSFSLNLSRRPALPLSLSRSLPSTSLSLLLTIITSLPRISCVISPPSTLITTSLPHYNH
jgi:hypothetical protein